MDCYELGDGGCGLVVVDAAADGLDGGGETAPAVAAVAIAIGGVFGVGVRCLEFTACALSESHFSSYQQHSINTASTQHQSTVHNTRMLQIGWCIPF